jgi:hypothetical protein
VNSFAGILPYLYSSYIVEVMAYNASATATLLM